MSHMFSSYFILHVKSCILTLVKFLFLTNQQTIGGMNGEATGKGVMDGEPIHISGLPVASPLVNIPAHVEMDGIAAGLALLAHVLQLHV